METSLIAQLAYLVSAILFVSGIKQLSSPATARSGNARASVAMLLAIVVTLLDNEILDWTTVAAAVIASAVIGGVLARKIEMTAMPQLVAVFNGFGGGASAAVAAAEFVRLGGGGGGVELGAGVTIVLSTLIGAVTFSGSLIAFGKLQGIVTGKPVTFPLQKSFNALLFLAVLVLGAGLADAGVGDAVASIFGADALEISGTFFLALVAGALILGVLLVIPIGGADMPVVVSLLNSYSGLAAAATGFVLGNMMLIIAGSLVGAAGLILTQLMCKAMNRSLGNVAFGAFGTDGPTTKAKTGERPVRDVDAEQAAMVLAYAGSVAVVPGYGLAVAQAQHELKKVCDLLEERGVRVRFGVHPVAGRMPGHMNVLLAEADVSYDKLLDLDDINAEFDTTDVVLIVGANDVVNPAARDPDSVIAGMPILDVDKARTVIVMKRSLSPGFAGIDNDLFYMENTLMFFGDAAQQMSELVKEVREA
ncbi:MAG: NAD(P)(+) transhydrogenase (Re/Si-specific) subunit beta [Gemmatimonadetes bacterium]|nr:NAD(P)(+) transhydrogenase (Re/Si-specific) subunit beta [Gemmatimonadota bacterium]MYB99990.1 NAD(P)(+) transhydrogenase (Re/Si-specific) subunit beta [Gemmatimonadota bacterium]